MRIELGGVFRTPGTEIPFSYQSDLSDVCLSDEHPFRTPISVSGWVRNLGGTVFLSLCADFAGEAKCDRCLVPIREEKTASVYAEVLPFSRSEEEEAEDVVYADGNGFLDLDPILRSACILAWDGQHLCSPSCLGLCPSCGKNLNEGSCTCKKKSDPRFQVLAQLLENN